MDKTKVPDDKDGLAPMVAPAETQEQKDEDKMPPDGNTVVDSEADIQKPA
jgi:hypothetical protein